MTRFKNKVALLFTAVLLVLFMVFYAIVYLYSVEYIEDRTSSRLQKVNASGATYLENQINQDYRAFQTYAEGKDLETIQAGLESITFFGGSYVGAFEILENAWTDGDTTYPRLPNYTPTYLEESIFFYRLSDFLENQTDDTIYGFFVYNHMVVYYEMEPYLKAIASLLYEHLNVMIMYQDGFIYYQSSANTQMNISQYLDDSKSYVNQYFKQGLENTIITKKNQKDIFFTFNTLSLEALETKLYFISVYDYETQMMFDYNLVTMIRMMLFALIVVYVLLMYIVFRIIERKNADIEASRLLHYYIKPILLYVNRKGKIVFYNKAFKEMVPNYHEIKKVNEFSLEENTFYFEVEDLIARQKIFDVTIETIEGSKMIRFIPLKRASGYALVGEDITNKDIDYQTYRMLALYHPTTRLPNLNHFKITVNEQLANDKFTLKSNSAVLININDFKTINKLMGEQIADEVLKNLGRIILDHIGDYQAKVYNTESDHFVIVFEDQGYEKTETWTNQFVKLLDRPINVSSGSIRISVRAAIFHLNREVYNISTSRLVYDNLIRTMNRAKQLHQAVLVFDLNLNKYINYQNQMAKDLVKAIAYDEFVLHLQPQYHNQIEKIIGFEALIRWKNDKYEKESPAQFIKLAEENNLIIEIGKVVIDKTFKIAKELEKYQVKISMNVSPVQMLQAGFVQDLIESYEKHQLKKGAIAIEITETFLMSSFEEINDKIRYLKEYGIDIHLDDFGTGYSSLLYLQELPINTIKIDRSFIMNLPQEKYSKAVVGMIVNLAKNLELEIIAEGVETESQNQYLANVGADVIQGYLVSKAVPIEQAIELLEAYNIKKTKTINVELKNKKKGPRF